MPTNFKSKFLGDGIGAGVSLAAALQLGVHGRKVGEGELRILPQHTVCWNFQHV